MVEGNQLTMLEVRRFPNKWSAQTCELYSLNQALKLLKEKEGTIYMDSKYAFWVVHTYGKIWTKRVN
jgi:ribonuclease HI